MSTRNLLVMGDSISVHYGPFLAESVAGTYQVQRLGDALEALTNLDIPRGANVGDSDNALKILRPICEAGKMTWDTLLLNCGLHDIRRHMSTQAYQVPIERYRTNLEQIVSLMKPQPTRLVWVRTTPCDEKIHNQRATGFHRYSADVEAYNEVADTVMKAGGIQTIDLYNFTLSLDLGSAVFSDHVHFPEPVRKKQADFIASKLIN